MTLPDVTIDTNVLMHAGDPRQGARQLASLAFVNTILNSSTFLCVDEGFDLDPSRNSSFIAAEYIQGLHQGTPGYVLVSAMAQSKRIQHYPRTVKGGPGNVIRRLVSDKADRKFLAVAYQSQSKRLYSHDFQHFHNQVRRQAANDIEVRILAADE